MSVKNTTFNLTKEEWAQYIHRRARELRAHQNQDELLMGGLLTPLGFEPQVVVGGRYIVDFLHPQYYIAVELDGKRHWKSLDSRLRDAKREKWLLRHGGISKLFRFTHKDVQTFGLEARDLIARYIHTRHGS